MFPITDAELPTQHEAARLAALNAQSERDDVALVEIVYKGRFARFDISTMQAQYLTPQQLVERCFVEAFKAVQLPTLLAESSAFSSSSL